MPLLNSPDMAPRFLLLLLASLLAACGDSDEVRLRLPSGSKLYTQPSAQRVARDAAVELRVCGQDDPLPHAVDDESSLCAVVQLDAPALDALPGDATLRIQGSAVVPVDFVGQPASFEPGGDHAPAVLAAWVTLGCFAPPLVGPSVQQVRGELRFEERSAERWRGRLEMHMDGTPGGSECVTGATGADFDVRFEAR